jgi:hypothetical protein
MPKTPHSPEFEIDTVVSSSRGVRLEPKLSRERHQRLLEQREVFSFKEYARAGRSPEPLPEVDLTPLESSYPRCLDMPIRMAGRSGYYLPYEWIGLKPLLEELIGIEHQHNDNWREYYTYITVDCKYVKPEEQQRHGGLHVDGFQGSRITRKTKITRNYVMTTNGGTRFYPQPFIVADETKFNVFQGFDLQAEDFIVAEENTAYFMDAYTVHESGFASREGIRTFLRLTYDLKKFDRSGNTHNSMIDYHWDMFDRKVHDTVATPTLEDIQNSPYRV